MWRVNDLSHRQDHDDDNFTAQRSNFIAIEIEMKQTVKFKKFQT